MTFVFQQKNHTATQSTFANPCSPSPGGFDSGLCVSLSFHVPLLKSDPFVFQHPRIRQQYQWTFPAGPVPGDRYQPGLGILSPDWSLSKGNGFRHQSWNQVRRVPGSCHGEYHHKFLFYCFSGGVKRSSHCHCVLEFSLFHVSGSQNYRWWHHPDLRALEYHRAARRHHHL